MFSRISLLIVILFTAAFTFFYRHLPFFWDMAHFSEIGVFFYQNGFNSFLLPFEMDEGPFPFWGIYLALGWKCFGYHLEVAHLLMWPFIAGTLIGFYKLCRRFLNDGATTAALILIICDPTFSTQCLLMSYDVVLLCCFLWGVVFLMEGKKTAYAICLIFVAISNIRGPLAVLSLLIIQWLFAHRQTSLRYWVINLLYYAPAVLTIVGWAFYHHEHTGWYLFSPRLETTVEKLTSGTMPFRQFIYILWKLGDMGRIFLWVFVVAGSWWLYRRKQLSSDWKQLIVLLIIPTAVFGGVMIFFSNPIGHKYFLVPYAMLILITVYLLQQAGNLKTIVAGATVCALLLISGNWWTYPQKYGNGWDSSLKVLPYFELKKELTAYMAEQSINSNETGALYPLIQDTRFTELSPHRELFLDLDTIPVEKCRYVVVSNIYNTMLLKQLNQLQQEWELVKTFKKGQVELMLYEHW